MKINCGPTEEERISALQDWHSWFAWHPVRIGSNDCRWLETIERKGTPVNIFDYDCGYSSWSWEYRA